MVGGAPNGVRLPENVRGRLPADTWDAAHVSAGLALRLVSYAEAVAVDLVVSPRHRLAAPTMGEVISVWVGSECRAAVEVPEFGGRVRVPLSSDGETHTIYLPESRQAFPTGLVPIGGCILPVEPAPRWIAYGDSITQGWSVSDPGRSYPAIAGRSLGLDVWNLGFAASARGELVIAEYLATLESHVVTLAFGTNNWSTIPTGAIHLGGIVRDFVGIIRGVRPQVPIVVISPIVRPAAESTPNLLGATLTELRRAIEDTVSELASTDRALALIPGAHLVDKADLVDGIHPGDAGHLQIADALISAIGDVTDIGRQENSSEGE